MKKETLWGIALAVVIQLGIVALSAYFEYGLDGANGPDEASIAKYDTVAVQVRRALADGKAIQAIAYTDDYLKNPEPLIPKEEMRNLHQIASEAAARKAHFWYTNQQYDSAVLYYETLFYRGSKPWYDSVKVDALRPSLKHSSVSPERKQKCRDYAIASKPNSYPLLFEKSMILKEVKEKDQARKVLKEAVDIIIKNYEARYGKAYATVMDPQKDKLPQLQRDVFLAYAESLEEAGDHKMARSNRSWARFLAGSRTHHR